jgi:hypothetical protein
LINFEPQAIGLRHMEQTSPEEGAAGMAGPS